MSDKKAAPLTSALLARKGTATPATVVRISADAPLAVPDTTDDAGSARPDHAPDHAPDHTPDHTNGKAATRPAADHDDAPKDDAAKSDRRNGSATDPTTGDDNARPAAAPARPASEEAASQSRATIPPAPKIEPGIKPEAGPAAPAGTTGQGMPRRAKIVGAVAITGFLGGLAALSIAVAVDGLSLEPPAPPRKAVERTISPGVVPATVAPSVPVDSAEVSVLPLAPPSADAASAPAESTPPAPEPKADTTPENTAAAAASAAGAAPLTAPSTAPRPVRRPVELAVAAAPVGRYTVQVSSVGSASAARREIRRLKRLYPATLGSMSLEVYAARGRYRIVTERYPTRAEATAFCGELNQAGRSCLVLRR